jgi:hypothetical protein
MQSTSDSCHYCNPNAGFYDEILAYASEEATLPTQSLVVPMQLALRETASGNYHGTVSTMSKLLSIRKKPG